VRLFCLPEINLSFADWSPYDGGGTIGIFGSESGKIVYDLQNDLAARITLEQGGDTAPYAVTFGIYGLMFHTHFCGSLEEGLNYIEATVPQMDISLHSLPIISVHSLPVIRLIL
jgi:hypothetical protein